MPPVISNKIHLGTRLKILTAQCRHLSTGVDWQLLQQKPLNMLVRVAELGKSPEKQLPISCHASLPASKNLCFFSRVRSISFLLLGVNCISE